MALSREQQSVARQIIAAGNARKAPRHVIRAAIATALVEANLGNPSSGDRDSQGAFQQRPSAGWGTPAQVTNVTYAANKFYDKAIPLFQRGVRGGKLAQAVQVSAFPGRYQPQFGPAGQILRGLGAGAGTGATAAAGPQRVLKEGTAPSSVPTILPPNSLIPKLAQPSSFIAGQLQTPPLLSSGVTKPGTPPILAPARGPQLQVDKKGRPIAGAPAKGAAPTGVQGAVSIASGADRAGVSIKPQVVNFVKQVAGVYGKKLTIGTGTNHDQFVVGTTRQSDHWTGNAADIPAAGKALTRLGQSALIAAGMPVAQARKQTGGLFNIAGHQIIFNSMIGGNHYNHLHVSSG